MHPIQYLVNNMMLPILAFFFDITKNYGLAIVLLTITIKLLLFPFTAKQHKSMAGVKVLQPKIKELQAKYKDNPQMSQTKMMELYKEYGVNPLGSCLPTLIQLPFFIAIFYTLNSANFKTLLSAEGVNASFLWLKNLGEPDPLFILPILVALSTYFSQKTMSPGSSKDDPQMKMLAYMPFIMLFICFKMPSGVLIYWALSQGLTSLQQYYLNKMAKQPATQESTPPTVEVTTAKKPEKKIEKITAKKNTKNKSNLKGDNNGTI